MIYTQNKEMRLESNGKEKEKKEVHSTQCPASAVRLESQLAIGVLDHRSYGRPSRTVVSGTTRFGRERGITRKRE